MRAPILSGLLLLALTGCFGTPKKAHPEVPVKSSRATQPQDARGAASSQKGAATTSSVKPAPLPARTNTLAAAPSTAPPQTPASHAPAELAVADSTHAAAVPVQPPPTVATPTPGPASTPPPAITASPVPVTTTVQGGAAADRYAVLDSALHHVLGKLSSSDKEKKSIAAYLLQQGEFTRQLVASFAGNQPEVEEYRLPKGFDLDTYREGTGLSIKVWSAQIQELAEDRALVKVSWSSGKRTAGAYLLTLRLSNGKWQVTKEE